MDMTHGKSGLLIGFTLAVLAFFLCFLPTLSQAQDYDFWVQTPTHWNDKTDRLGNDLKKQVMSPEGDAFIEVYAAKGNNIGVQAIADGMEASMRQRGTAYLQNRVSSRDFQADGQPAVLREYTGVYNNLPLRSYALYAFGNGGRFAVFGVFMTSQAAKYQDTVYTCVTSLRFSPPGQQPAQNSSTTPYGIAGAAGGGSPYGATSPGGDCSAIVGKWHWFTGSTAEFGPNGTIPGNGTHHWECLDNGKTFRISWNNGQWIDTLTLTQNGQRLEGKNQKGNTVWGTRIGAAPAAPAVQPPVSGCARVAGKWHWFTGSTLELGPNGQVPGKHATHWQCLDNGKTFRISWNNGQWIDTLTLTEDGQRLEGTNQKGGRVWGTRIGTAPAAVPATGSTAEPPGPAGTDVPKTDKAVKISGNMGAQWGFAHGSLNPSEPSEWKLAATRAVTLSFSDPYKKGQQRYTVRVKTPSGSVVATTQVGLSAALNLSAGTYIVEVTTDSQYAGWRCEWK